MEVTAKMPATLEERLEYGEELRVPASWEEFLDALEECAYRIEYDEGEIVSFMGYGTEQHEKLVGKIIHLLSSLLEEDLFHIYSSNLALHIPGRGHRYYNADCVVVKGMPEKVPLRGEMSAVANPILIVEVLSDSTRGFDLGRKSRNYRKIPSLQQILFIESAEMLVVSHTRHNGGNEWLLQDFSNEEDIVPVLGQSGVKLADLYRNVAFEQEPDKETAS
jgi:Uma2 family endonuclease